MDYKYTSIFTTIARVAAPTEQDRFIAKASLLPLRGILPADVDPANDPDLLYFASNGAVAGLVNKNQDAVSCAAGLAIHKSARNKYVSTDHERNQVVGVVLYPGLSRFGSNEPITEEQAAAEKAPFNMAFAGVLWKVINPMLSKYVSHSGMGDDSLSMSWEIAFQHYDIGVGSRNLYDAQVIKADDPSFAAYDKLLRSNGGDGKDHSGKEVFRIIGDDAVILGYSIVPNPAAEVKGILPITNEPLAAPTQADPFPEIPASQRAFLDEQMESGAGYHTCDLTMKDGTIHEGIRIADRRFLPLGIDSAQIASVIISKKSEEKNITSSEARVNPSTEQKHSIMKIQNLQEIESQWGEIRKLESSAAIVDFVKAIQKGSEEFSKNLSDKENLVKAAEQAKADSEKRAKELQASIDDLKGQLDQIKQQAQAAEANQKYQERMAAFDEEFVLDDEDRKIVGSDIQGLDDTSYAAYMAKCKKLMSGKAKKAKPAAPKDDNPGDNNPDDDDDDQEDKKEKAKAAIQAALASVVPDKGTPDLRSDPAIDASLVSQLADAFGASIKINGKKIERKSKK